MKIHLLDLGVAAARGDLLGVMSCRRWPSGGLEGEERKLNNKLNHLGIRECTNHNIYIGSGAHKHLLHYSSSQCPAKLPSLVR